MSRDDLIRRHPILSAHWPNFPPPQDEPPPHIRDLRLQRDVVRLHKLGPRAIYHLLDEIGCRHLCRTFIEDHARQYADLDPAVLRQLGGMRSPPSPIHRVAP